MIIKEKSTFTVKKYVDSFVVRYYMNLHEESLLKYLLNPTNIAHSTALMILNNAIVANRKIASEKQEKNVSFSYNANRI